MAKTIRFNIKAQRYINEKGQFISETFVENSLQGYRTAIITRVVNQFTSFDLTVEGNTDKLLNTIAQEIKQATLTNYVVGRGGIKQLTPVDIDNLNKILKDELTTTFTENGTYGLQEVFSSYENGEISYAQLRARTINYVKGSRKSYYAGKAELNNKPFMRRFLNGDNHCSDCVAYADVGMVRAGDLPLPGVRCACHSNCNCTVDYYSDKQYQKWVGTQLTSFTDAIKIED
jgi:Holliday junction resolvase RusA-like endonuclease